MLLPVHSIIVVVIWFYVRLFRKDFFFFICIRLIFSKYENVYAQCFFCVFRYCSFIFPRDLTRKAYAIFDHHCVIVVVEKIWDRWLYNIYGLCRRKRISLRPDDVWNDCWFSTWKTRGKLSYFSFPGFVCDFSIFLAVKRIAN